VRLSDYFFQPGNQFVYLRHTLLSLPPTLPTELLPFQGGG